MFSKRGKCIFGSLLLTCFSLIYLFDLKARIDAEYDKHVWHYSIDPNPRWNFTKNRCTSHTDINSNKSEIERLSHEVQESICRLQNPADCNESRLLLCRIRSDCALGCQLHHFVSCLMLAIGTNRTLVIDNARMRGKDRGLLVAYLPLSDVCTTFTRSDVIEAIELTGKTTDAASENHRLAKTTIYWNLPFNTSFTPFTVPDVLSQRLKDITKHPPNFWWTGQLVKYVTRLQPHMVKLVDTVKAELKFLHPIVGVHVRRSDKVMLESNFKDLDAYMSKVKIWYEAYAKRTSANFKRRVFLASDDPSVYRKAIQRYPEYEILSLHQSTVVPEVDSQFFHQFNLYSAPELQSIALDVQLLSECDFLVCTFSSNVGRLVYELMSVRPGFIDEPATSLDLEYNYHGSVHPMKTAKFAGLILPSNR